MSNTWNSYYVLFLSAIMALGIPISLAILSSLLGMLKGSETKTKAKATFLGSPGGGQKSTGAGPDLTSPQPSFNQKINVRFFMAANAALILITLGLALIPCVTTIQTEKSEDLARGLLAIVTLAGFASLGLTYSVRKGNMDWLTSDYVGKNKIIEKG